MTSARLSEPKMELNLLTDANVNKDQEKGKRERGKGKDNNRARNDMIAVLMKL